MVIRYQTECKKKSEETFELIRKIRTRFSFPSTGMNQRQYRHKEYHNNKEAITYHDIFATKQSFPFLHK